MGSAQITVDGRYVDHRFDSTSPFEAHEALRKDANDKLVAAKRRRDASENAVQIASAAVKHFTGVIANFNAAIAALPAGQPTD